MHTDTLQVLDDLPIDVSLCSVLVLVRVRVLVLAGLEEIDSTLGMAAQQIKQFSRKARPLAHMRMPTAALRTRTYYNIVRRRLPQPHHCTACITDCGSGSSRSGSPSLCGLLPMPGSAARGRNRGRPAGLAGSVQDGTRHGPAAWPSVHWTPCARSPLRHNAACHCFGHGQAEYENTSHA